MRIDLLICSTFGIKRWIRFQSRLLIASLLLSVLLPNALAQPNVVWEEDFESQLVFDNWHFEGGTWEIGKPSSGPGKAYQGTNRAATVLGGNHAPSSDARLIRDTRFVVPPASTNPRLTFWHWFNNFTEDPGWVEMRVLGGQWESVSPLFSWNSDWTLTSIDLSKYAGQRAQIAFHFSSNDDSNVAAGWYVDDIQMVTGLYTIDLVTQPEGFEAGIGQWYADRGQWQAGTPKNGPGKARSGNNCLGTILAPYYAANGTYTALADSRFISPPFPVACAQANPRLRFWHWYSIGGGDEGSVEIREVGSAWQKVGDGFKGNSGSVWTTGFLDLAPFAGKTVQLAFRFQSNSDSSVGAGWFIDDVRLQSDALDLIGDKTVDEAHLLTFAVNSSQCSNVRYSLGPGAPEGAKIDPDLGIFTWVPSECQGPGTYVIPVQVNPLSNTLMPLASTSFTVTVLESNAPPVIDPIEPKPVQANEPLRFTISAFDPDCPVKQTLSFSLDQGAPAGATIDPVAGVFSWTPTAAQAASRHSIAVRVTDDGSPALSSTLTFLAVPDVPETRVSASRLSGGTVRLVIDGGLTGTDYTIQATAELKSPPSAIAWTTLKIARPDQFPFTFDDPEAATLPMRFYRVVQLP
jgi:hypothetical protein